MDTEAINAEKLRNSPIMRLECVDRPIITSLIFLLGIDDCYGLYMDRFNFSYDHGSEKFTKKSDIFSQFISQSRLTSEEYFPGDLTDFLSHLRRLTDRGLTANLLVERNVGGAKFLTSIHLTKFKNGKFIYHSYIRAHYVIEGEISIQDLSTILYQSQEGFYIQSIVGRGFCEPSKIEDDFNRFYKEKILLIDKMRQIMISDGDKSNSGANGIFQYIETHTKKFPQHEQHAKNGIPNSLLAYISNDLYFTIDPFLAALSVQKPSPIQQTIFTHTQEITSLQATTTSLGLMFGKDPSEKTYGRFLNNIHQVAQSYEKIAKLFCLYGREIYGWES